MKLKHVLTAAILVSQTSAHGPIGLALAADGVVLPLPAEDRQELDTHLGVGVVGQALTSVPITDTSIYFPLHDRTANYNVTSQCPTRTTTSSSSRILRTRSS